MPTKSRKMSFNGYEYYTHLTKDEIEELKKCRKSFLYFRKYIKITDAISSHSIPMKLYKKQEEFINLMNKNHFVIVLKSRQTGMSTISGQYALWIQLFYPKSYIGILSKSGNDATKYLNDKIRKPFEELPTFIKEKVLIDNKRNIEFGNGSEIISSASTTTAFRGRTLTYLIVDEQQFIPHIDETFQALIGTMSKVFSIDKDNTTIKRPYGISIISTPNGVNNWYHKMWTSAINKENMYTPLSFHWKEIEGLGEEWYQAMKKQFNNDERRINQELEMKFLGSGDTYFNAKRLENINTKKPIEIKKIPINGEYTKYEELYIWEQPNPNKQYVYGVDVQTKLGDDRSTIEILDQNTFNQVQEYMGKNINFKDFQNLIQTINKTMYPGLVQIERNNNGIQVIEHLQNIDINIPLYYDDSNKNRKYGFATTAKTRPQILNYFYEVLEEDNEFIRSERLLHEMLTFEYNSKNKPEQSQGNHDDLVMQFAIGLYVSKQTQKIQYMKPEDRLNLLKAFYNSNEQNINNQQNITINRWI